MAYYLHSKSRGEMGGAWDEILWWIALAFSFLEKNIFLCGADSVIAAINVANAVFIVAEQRLPGLTIWNRLQNKGTYFRSSGKLK